MVRTRQVRKENCSAQLRYEDKDTGAHSSASALVWFADVCLASLVARPEWEGNKKGREGRKEKEKKKHTNGELN